MKKIIFLIFILIPTTVFAGNYKNTPDPSMTINSMAYPDRIVGQLFELVGNKKNFVGTVSLIGPDEVAGVAHLVISKDKKLTNKPLWVRFRMSPNETIDYPVKAIRHNNITTEDTKAHITEEKVSNLSLPVEKALIKFILNTEGRPIPGKILGHGEIASYERTDTAGPACENECYIAKVFTEKASLGTMGNKYPVLKQEAKKLLSQCKTRRIQV